MRRASGYVLVGLGTFAVVLGLLLRFYLYPYLAVVDLDESFTFVSQGHDMVLFDRGELVQRRGVDLTATLKVEGDLTAPESKVGGDVAVWAAGLVVQDPSNTVVSATQQRVCIDRHTNAALRECTRQFVNRDENVNTSVRQTGQIIKFPIGTQRHGYPYFDTNTLTAPEARFDGTDKVKGLSVYRFVQNIPPTKMEDMEVPGNLVGGAEGTSVTAGRYYQNTRTLWVEPTTGIIVKDQQQMKQWLRSPDGRDGTVVLEGTFNATDDTIRRFTDLAEEKKAGLTILRGTPSLVSIVVGVLLVAAGVVVTVRRRRTPAGVEAGDERPTKAMSALGPDQREVP
jgi:hypothetical protein